MALQYHSWHGILQISVPVLLLAALVGCFIRAKGWKRRKSFVALWLVVLVVMMAAVTLVAIERYELEEAHYDSLSYHIDGPNMESMRWEVNGHMDAYEALLDLLMLAQLLFVVLMATKACLREMTGRVCRWLGTGVLALCLGAMALQIVQMKELLPGLAAWRTMLMPVVLLLPLYWLFVSVVSEDGDKRAWYIVSAALSLVLLGVLLVFSLIQASYGDEIVVMLLYALPCMALVGYEMRQSTAALVRRG